jgi:hypothetical protein
MEALHTLEWCDSKVDKVPHIEGDRSPLWVSITLLSGLGCFQTVADELDLLLGFLNNIWSKYLTFSSLRPVERGTALASVESFKRGHLQTSLIAIIVGELREWQTVLPLGPIGQNAGSQHVFKDLVYPLCLTSSLWVIGCAERELRA